MCRWPEHRPHREKNKSAPVYSHAYTISYRSLVRELEAPPMAASAQLSQTRAAFLLDPYESVHLRFEQWPHTNRPQSLETNQTATIGHQLPRLTCIAAEIAVAYVPTVMARAIHSKAVLADSAVVRHLVKHEDRSESGVVETATSHLQHLGHTTA